MIAKERTLTDEMVAEITALFPRYPTKQAVTLPALHIVNDRLRCVPLEAVVEIAELLELAPAQVQDTLSFYGLFKQDAPHGKVRAWVCRSISCALRGGEEILTHLCHKAGVKPGETTADGALDDRIRRVPRRLRICTVYVGERDVAQGFNDRKSECVFK